MRVFFMCGSLAKLFLKKSRNVNSRSLLGIGNYQKSPDEKFLNLSSRDCMAFNKNLRNINSLKT